MAGSSRSAASTLQEAAASFLSTLKSKFRTSEGAIDFVIKEVSNLTDTYLEFLKEELTEKLELQDGHLSLKNISVVLDSLQGQSFFEGVHSQPYLDSFIAHRSCDDNPFGLTQLVFDYKIVFRRGIPYKVPKDCAYFPPFLPQLEQLLNCKDVLHCVDNPKPSKDGVLRSVTDGIFYKCHFVVRRHGNGVLSIIIYVDDVEFADPCKSKTKKHKLRLFYWTLGNIYPELRSSLKSINLLAIARYEVAKKYGNDEILKYFINDLKDLADGVMLTVNGEQRKFYGILQFVSADMPAAANLAGMKESHFALRPCRVCMVTRYELCDHFEEVEGLLRKIVDHEKFVEEVEGNGVKQNSVSLVKLDVNLEAESDSEFVDVEVSEEDDLVQDDSPKYTDHCDPSVNYGINRRSVLSGAPGFDVTKCFPFDIMHAIFEGTAELLCRLLLKEMCLKKKKTNDQQQSEKPSSVQPKRKRNQKGKLPSSPQRKRKRNSKSQQETETSAEKPKVSLKFVNQTIQEACDFGHLHVSKPSPIEKSHLNSKLKQSASQMIVLVHILPFLAVGNVSEEKLDLLGQMLKIISYIMKFETTELDMDEFEAQIVTFGENFIRIYPEYKTLKLHCLKHLKMQTLLHGPLRQQACFRFEAMHREFTRLVDIINNMLNIEYSLICRYLSARNNDIMNGKEDGSFLYSGDTIRKSPLNALSSLDEKDVILEAFPEVHPDVGVATVESFVQHGRCWAKDVIVSLKGDTADASFGIIVKIFILNEEFVFLYHELKVTYFSKFHAFEILRRENVVKCIKLSHLKLQFPVARFDIHFGPNRTKSFLVSGSSGNIVA
ncbi:uncharacterized protein LOC117653726 [Thrips palmi]|uniref:Uncharacterized protein LOC117653726 n=1 Tax=Thrips palmi TaxID=161013 RepID=A0A6P9AJ46_THRPL|nr:uncharacterized protein LOC117653726 [Thrips palmi]XP_034255472.1 uncharacterized protein LOC117653726 [Thrips palmi]XP_034255473.1 uncharacterized protein LOC117653726 [Thrips palmi]